MFLKSIDSKLEYLGFLNINEGPNYVYYEKIQRWGTQKVDLFHKDGNKHLIQSYEKKENSDSYNNMAGITAKEAKLFIKKMKSKGWKLNYNF